jgi:hypothetical protein
MKTNDSLYCIKNIKSKDISNVCFTENKKYAIFYAGVNRLQILDNEFDIWYFYINKDELYKDNYKFYDHFVTLNQYRKLKLEKIYERR